MTQEEEDLLFKDLCCRLPYGVKVESIFINPDTKEHKLCGIEVLDATCLLIIRDGLGKFKPYLFPISSMTEEQKKDMIMSSVGIGSDKNVFDWYNKNHFDWRGLIPKGLAEDATGRNIY